MSNDMKRLPAPIYANAICFAVCIAICAAVNFLLNGNIRMALLPHKITMEYLFDMEFKYVDNLGYEQTDGLFAITRNCMGVKLFISLFLIAAAGFLRKSPSIPGKAAAIVKSFLLAVIAAIPITLARIAASVPFCAWDRFYLFHNVFSLLIYFVPGLALFYFMEKKDEKNKRILKAN